MYGGSGKLGRGCGGRGSGGSAGKRNTNFHQPPIHRPASSSGRLSSGSDAGPHNRNTTSGGPTASAPSAGAEEMFSLVTGNPLDFAMIIRLAPDLVEEIKRAEEDGAAARIKFDSNPNNPSGNVIDVGGKDFRFTWSREMGDLCDIYEERRSGEDGNGLLVESGCAWRKLNVQRVLDESTKNHVKMRSEEAEKKLKSRKAIILDHGNPSMKSQVKAIAAAESNPWKKPFKQKGREFKKRKIEMPPAVGGPPKSAPPLPPASSFRTGNPTKGPTSVEDIMAIHVTNKEHATNSEKDVPNRANSGVLREKAGRQGNFGAKPIDMQSMLISILMEKPEGMSMKALEKAVGDTIPTSIRKIEPIIKKIATFQAPGRYILKSGVELKNSKKPLSEIGSSPEYNHHQTPAPPEDKCNGIVAPMPNFEENATPVELEKQTHLDYSNTAEDLDHAVARNDIQHHILDLFGEKKVSDNTEGGLAGSSSIDSGSDSDNSDNSGSDSGSRSKSKSPVGSGSRDSSDSSDSDASSNSKQGSDEDVNIMTSDDDKEESKPKLHSSEPGVLTSPIPWRRTPDVGSVQNGIDEKQDGSGSDVVEIEKDLPGETGMAVFGNSVPRIEGETPLEDNRRCSPDYQGHQASQAYIENLFGAEEDGFNSKKTDNYERISKGKSKSKSKRGSHSEKLQESKKIKLESLPQPKISPAPKKLSPERVSEHQHCKDHSAEMMNRGCRDGNADYSVPKVYDQGIRNKSVLDHQDSRRAVDISARVKSTDTAERPSIYAESLGRDIKYSEMTRNSQEGLPPPKGRLSNGDCCNTQEKKIPKSSKEGAFGDQHSTHFDSYNYGTHVEPGGKLKEPREVSNLHMGYSTKDKNRTDTGTFPPINGRGKILQRELSDLELGELRETLPEETPGAKKKFETSSFEQSQNKPSASDDCNSEKNKVKRTVKTAADLGKPNIMVAPPRNPDGSSKRTPEHHAEDLTGPHYNVVQSQDQDPQHLLSRVDRSEGTKKSTDVNCKFRHNEARASQGISLEGFGETHKQASVNAQQQHDNMKQEPVSHPAKENKTPKSNTATNSNEIRKETSLTENNDAGLKRMESSTDDNSCSYTKYEKEEPELKEPIKDIFQYKEYVQEYCEKYDSYCSLNKTLESYRNDFHKLGSDLENAKGNDTEKYYSILGQLKESYRQCGTRHKRMKKIFLVLHEELQHLKQMIKDYAVLYTRD